MAGTKMTETLILIPGFANDERAWKHQIENLKRIFDVRVFVMDRFSSRQEMVEYLLKHAPERFILAGHSMGGWVAQAAAAFGNERVTKLLLLNTWATLSPKMVQMQKEISQSLKRGRVEEIMQQYLKMLVHPSRLGDLHLIQALQSMAAHFPVPTLLKQIGAMLEDSSSLHYHASIRAPTLVLYSQQDELFPQEHELLLTGIKNSRPAEIEECGHASLAEKPEEITRHFLMFTQK